MSDPETVASVILDQLLRTWRKSFTELTGVVEPDATQTYAAQAALGAVAQQLERLYARIDFLNAHPSTYGTTSPAATVAWLKSLDAEEEPTMTKYFIYGKPGKVPTWLTYTRNPDKLDGHKKVHEFEASTAAEAASYCRGYKARWKESPDVFGDVHAFHQVTDLPHPDSLTSLPGEDSLALRQDLIEEEVNNELMPALTRLQTLQVNSTDLAREEVMVEIADGIIDAIYVLVGAGVTLGMPLRKVWDEVQRSNMAKVEGGIRRREDGKILKPEGWTPPDIAGALGIKKD